MAAPFHVLYASLSGNSQQIATLAHARLLRKRPDGPSRLVHADAVTLEMLHAQGLWIVVLSTWGQGELPADAEPLYHAIQTAGPHALQGVRFGLIALGDRRYPRFCAGGLTFAAALEAHGAQRLSEPLLLDGYPVERFTPDVHRWVDALQGHSEMV